MTGLALTTLGALMLLAWQDGMLGSILGAGLCIAWLIAAGCWTAARTGNGGRDGEVARPAPDGPPLDALFDQIPLPLLRVDAGRAQAINRASRRLFATDDRVIPTPTALLDTGQMQLRHEGRSWRIERVAGTGRALVMLVDIEAERRAAEAHADNEMIDILGHELLNGLSPIVSLADSAQVAAERGDARLPGILATLTRRIEGLERFTRAYRMLARLPDPVRAVVNMGELVGDLSRLFDERFGDRVMLSIEMPEGATGWCDRDQMTQGLWALLQNAAEAALAGTVAPAVTLAVAWQTDRLVVRVSDSGQGVAAPERARIFRPFHTTKPEGSGIGLTLARRIAQAHGGDLTLLPVAVTTFEWVMPDVDISSPGRGGGSAER
ncbi:HAMP domain-containing histidine kinase [Sphingomonas sanguinis]|uniref:histidine kinase n=1 Tax=Sphingomonas sanguinis TaxID=33051 RepID=A0ABU5LVN1_9SPHN|nr:HAMP domain-containing sensor histidine kinase [Sphingomonas sanguinis]MDZ7283985.1 HAMP domain-containing histidine kinase [Sphingomonas sanguinis]